MLVSNLNCIPPLSVGNFIQYSFWYVIVDPAAKKSEALAVITRRSSMEIKIWNQSEQAIAFECDGMRGELGPNLTLEIKKPMKIIFGVHLRPMSLDSFSVEVTEE